MTDFTKCDVLKLIREADEEELAEICGDLRRFIVNKVSVTGGHLASNLGVVELTVALHRVYNTPEDKIIFDVGHQAYIHKIITGRAGDFDTLRKYKGLSGFPKSRESAHDAYDTGHSSTSIGAAAGMAAGRDLTGGSYEVVAVIGDGSMTGGIAFEALNYIGSNRTNVKIILNDNGMSIARNVGAMSRHLQELRTSENYLKTKTQVKSALERIPVVGDAIAGGISKTKDKVKYSVLGDKGILFEELGIKYIGPINGYNIPEMEEAFRIANSYDGPTIVHVITTKGKGYYWAEKYPRKFHGVGPFDIYDGKMLSSSSGKSFSSVFGETLTELAAEDEKIVSIVAAMGTATGLGKFYDAFPDRFIDVGIAEQNAVVVAAGLAKAGLKPVVAIYSSFLQRALDMIIEDVALQDLHVVFAIDRAGLVGADGETHHGQFDISYLSLIPGITILSPADGAELRSMLRSAIDMDGPVAIRYPRGSSEPDHDFIPSFDGNNTAISEGKDAVILAVGNMLDTAVQAADELSSLGVDTGVIHVGVIKPFDASLTSIDTKLIVTIEDGAAKGGFGEMFKASAYGCYDAVLTYALPDRFISHGSVSELRQECGLTSDDIVKGVTGYFEGKA